MITVAIPYFGYSQGLVQLLVALQPQLHVDDDIYVFDLSPKKDALAWVRRYSSSRCYVHVETTPMDTPLAQKFAIQNTARAGGLGTLILTEHAVISNTLIPTLRRVNTDGYTEIFIPTTHSESFNKSFRWYNNFTSILPVSDVSHETPHMGVDLAKYIPLEAPQMPCVGFLHEECIVIADDPSDSHLEALQSLTRHFLPVHEVE